MPRLRIDPETLGTTAAAVEAGLSKAFKCAEKWQAVCLLDEADVFLEQRRNNDFTRNHIVSGQVHYFPLPIPLYGLQNSIS
jgi:hypothetical protein